MYRGEIEKIARTASPCPVNNNVFPSVHAGFSPQTGWVFELECPYGFECNHGPVSIKSKESMQDACEKWNYSMLLCKQFYDAEHKDESESENKKIVEIIFPEDFEFPPKYNITDCNVQGCPLALSELGCAASGEAKCPFYGGEDSCAIKVRENGAHFETEGSSVQKTYVHGANKPYDGVVYFTESIGLHDGKCNKLEWH